MGWRIGSFPELKRLEPEVRRRLLKEHAGARAYGWLAYYALVRGVLTGGLVALVLRYQGAELPVQAVVGLVAGLVGTGVAYRMKLNDIRWQMQEVLREAGMREGG